MFAAVLRQLLRGVALARTAAPKYISRENNLLRQAAALRQSEKNLLQMRPRRAFMRKSSASARALSVLLELLPCSNSIS